MIKVYAMIALALVITGLGWYAKAQTERAATAEAQVELHSKALTSQKEKITEYQTKLNEHERLRRVDKQNAAKWRRKWKDAQKSPDVQKWSAVMRPGAVNDRVCELARCQPTTDTPP